MDCHSKDLLTTNNHANELTGNELINRGRVSCFTHPPKIAADWCDVGPMTIDTLSNDSLLYIFYLYVNESWGTEAWCTLVHVCQRWRTLVFGSPRYLDVQLLCTERIQVKKMLDIWPALPIVIQYFGPPGSSVDNMFAALEHSNRVHSIALCGLDPSSELEKVVSMMQDSFPVLTDLRLELYSDDKIDETALVIPDSFLGGSAPGLRCLTLGGISFLGLPKLLLSATYLLSLQLWNIPHSAHISPKAMVTCLSALTSLKYFTLELKLPQTHPVRESRHSPSPTCTLLPSLTWLKFQGVSEYAEELVARIDTPLLNYLHIAFLNQPTFDTPHLFQFVARMPKFQEPNEARITFDNYGVDITRPSLTRDCQSEGLRLSILRESLVDQLSCLPQVCSRSLPAIVAVEHLCICMRLPYPQYRRRDNAEVNQWLAILRLFASVKSLYLSTKLTPRIAAALQQTVGVTRVLPALQNIFLQEYPPSGPVSNAIGQFVSAPRLSSHPISISRWDRDDEWYEARDSS
jgi:hypothetical protein